MLAFAGGFVHAKLQTSDFTVQCQTNTDYCQSKLENWGGCSCNGNSMTCHDNAAGKSCKTTYGCQCSDKPIERCISEWNMGCEKEACCAGLSCENNQCKAANPDAPSTNPFAFEQLPSTDEGWFIGCTSEVSVKDGMTKFYSPKTSNLVDGAKINVQDLVAAKDSTDLAIGFCTKECDGDSDCKVPNASCVAVGSLKICGATTCLSGMVKTDGICIGTNPFAYPKDILTYKTYFPVPNHTHGNYQASSWNLAKDAASYLPMHLANWNAGILLGHMIEDVWGWPLTKTNREYVYGTLFGQLFQESSPSEDPADIAKNIINPDPALLNPGQGGPYQLNDYSKQLPPNTPGADGMINYVALQHALGFTVEDQNDGKQTLAKGPQALNSVNTGAYVAGFFHHNDIKRYDIIMSQSYNDKSDEANNWRKCKENLKSGAFEEIDMLLNVIYNAGPYAAYAKMIFYICANPTDTELTNLKDYSLDDQEYVDKFQKMPFQPTVGTTYILYPRQIRYYTDQFTNNNDSLYKNKGAFANTNVAFTLQAVADQFTESLETLGYVSGGKYELFSKDFLQTNMPQGDLNAQLSFANPEDRDLYYTFVLDWYQALEAAGGFKFSAATDCTQTVGKDFVKECKPKVDGVPPVCDDSTPPTWCSPTGPAGANCICKKDVTGYVMHCESSKAEDTCTKSFHCSCSQSTGTTTAAPAPEKGDACSSQNCAAGLACLKQVYAPVSGDGNNQVWSQIRDQEQGTCQE